MLVVDASVVVPLLLDPGGTGETAVRRVAGHRLSAPALLDVEVVSVVRRLVLRGDMEAARGRTALADLQALPVVRHQHAGLVQRCFELRDSVSAYDASYVALAEALDATLVTADAPLSRAPGLRCPVYLLA